MQWYTQMTFVDKDSGEVIKPYQIDKGEFVVINQTIKHEYKNGAGIKHITKICEHNRQTKLF